MSDQQEVISIEDSERSEEEEEGCHESKNGKNAQYDTGEGESISMLKNGLSKKTPQLSSSESKNNNDSLGFISLSSKRKYDSDNNGDDCGGPVDSGSDHEMWGDGGSDSDDTADPLKNTNVKKRKKTKISVIESIDKSSGNENNSTSDFLDFDDGDATPTSEEETHEAPHGDSNDKDVSSTAAADEIRNVKLKQLENAKKHLSKWAARLFDPDRPRGLVEAPKSLPLNDVYLQEFGKREKDDDTTSGRSTNIDRSIPDDDDELDIEGEEGNNQVSNKLSKSAKKMKRKKSSGGAKSLCKVRVANLAFVSKESALKSACERYGPLEAIHLLMDRDKPRLSIGRAIVTFEDPESAKMCVESMNEKNFEGRPLRMSIIKTESTGKSGSGGGGGSLVRYWVIDKSRRCFRCREVGHNENECPNAEVEKQCPLCALTGHESRTCPLARVCFNCGIPGHVSRDCSQNRGLPKRVVCGMCLQSGHHRWQCQVPSRHILQNMANAKCIQCGKIGHYSCCRSAFVAEVKALKGGLEGMYCFNCGQQGHHGARCERPALDSCARNPSIAEKEIERAGQWEDAPAIALRELEKALGGGNSFRHGAGSRNPSYSAAGQQSRGRSIYEDDRPNRRRVKSQPPPNESRREYQIGHHGREATVVFQSPTFPPPPPPRNHRYVPPPPPPSSRHTRFVPPPPPPPPPRQSRYDQQHRYNGRGYR
mmetsp:Transcript_57675/g.69379  ORF Transcript_57675/g.69379 Transcript_57675/m.69379 type:complete len:707 (-) Transcript_57675:281-2401(-)